MTEAETNMLETALKVMDKVEWGSEEFEVAACLAAILIKPLKDQS